ncbi:MAG: hypothetical protein A2287_04695 [Candidatus Melainabacteria bacterium RIFOXYA12_FULL_32_12]|nr:MAG: hypothetical protein A2287_04695 [Candidatus Melainabacteria bacterium RIFOXYA12_FULL_32_12]
MHAIVDKKNNNYGFYNTFKGAYVEAQRLCGLPQHRWTVFMVDNFEIQFVPKPENVHPDDWAGYFESLV